jgi:hypothetical protein
MLTFHATLHARPALPLPTRSVELNGATYQAIDPSTELLATPFDLSFEEVYFALERLPRMYIEPDGSFVWTSSVGKTSWQLDGVLYDRAQRLLHVDLKGTCPSEVLDRLLMALGWPARAILFEVVREGVFLEEAEFRRYASGNA